MKNNIVLNAPINALSMGQVSFCILKELYKKNYEVSFNPIGNLDFSAYAVEHKFADFINKQLSNRLKYSRCDKQIKVWHISNANERLSKNQQLLTFHETNIITDVEKDILKLQDRVVVSSNYQLDIFEQSGVDNASFAPLACSEGIYKINKDYKTSKYIHFGLMGKFEKRKNTKKIIELWVKKYGNNPKFKLTCCVTNPFYKGEDMEKVIRDALGNKNYFNVSFLPYLKTNAEVNDFLNSIDIDLTGLSGAEGWNLPAFNATALGKWSCVSNCTAHRDWATAENSILVEPCGMKSVVDGIFFNQEQPFNQGLIYSLSDESIIEAFEKSEKLAKTNNSKGAALYEKEWGTVLDELLK